MKKIIFKILIILIAIVFVFLTYLSTVGIETTKFNSQISKQVKNLNGDLEFDLKQIKILLDPITFSLKAKTIGPKLKFKEKVILIESIKTQISINSFFKEKFPLKNLDISTKSLEIKNLISFLRNINNTPQFYFLDKIIKKGFLIADIKIDFDDNGKIKNNFKINGFLRDVKISFLENYKIDKLNLNFEVKHKKYFLEEIKFKLNEIPIISKKINVENIKNEYLVSGEIENKSIEFKKEAIDLLFKPFFEKIDILNLSLKSKNKFSLKIINGYKIKNFEIASQLDLENLLIKNDFNLNYFFPDSKKEIDFRNHLINLNFKDKKLSIDGKGNILLQKNNDKISYSINKYKKKFEFLSSLEILNNSFIIDLINYKKENNSNLNLKVDGVKFIDKDIVFNSISLNDQKNNIEIKDLIVDNNFKIEKFEKIKLDYFDSENLRNQLKIDKKKNSYFVYGQSFNSNKLIDHLIDTKNNNNLNLFKNNFKVDLKIDEVFVDSTHSVKSLEGKLTVDKNKIIDADIKGNFSNNEKFFFTVKSDVNEKVTTLFLDRAEPIVKRYKFIKGFENGKLDFYSLKKGKVSNSTLKIYDFKLKKLPTLTKILTLASLQGIADIFSGEGIGFEEFEMNFRNNQNLMNINEIYAIGPAISIMMEGYVEKGEIISLRGTLVPATTINKVIGSLPILGKILVGKKTGEGVFGVSFKIKGPPNNLDTTVNPIKTLTPRFITRTLEKIKKN